MSTRNDRDAVHDFIARLLGAVNAHDATAIAALCAEQVVWEDPAAPRTLHGRDAVLGFHRDVMFVALPDVHIELVDGPYLGEDEGRFAMRLLIRGTMTGPLDPPGFAPTGGALAFETAEFSRLQHGLLVEHKVVLDMLDLARQIGAVPGAGSLGARVGTWLQHASAHWQRRNRAQRDARARNASRAP